MNRFHSKFHRKNHHTDVDKNNPDAGHDPIASKTAPFQGGFFLNGSLSASGHIKSNGIYALSGLNTGTVNLGTGGVATVKTSSVTTSSIFILTTQNPSGTVGMPYVFSKDIVNTTFTIASTETADRSTIGWFIVQAV
jgi:hypothetical protein